MLLSAPRTTMVARTTKPDAGRERRGRNRPRQGNDCLFVSIRHLANDLRRVGACDPGGPHDTAAFQHQRAPGLLRPTDAGTTRLPSPALLQKSGILTRAGVRVGRVINAEY